MPGFASSIWRVTSQTIQIGHRNIDYRKIWFEFIGLSHGIGAVRSLALHLPSAMGEQQAANTAANQAVIVSD